MKVAICICTCCRPALLGRLLDVIAGIDPGPLRPEEILLIVVDNAPTGDVRRLCEAHQARSPFALTYGEEPRRGISHARNTSVRLALHAQADLIAFVDDDDIPRRDWLCRLLETQRRTGAGLVFGLALWPPNLAVPTWVKQLPVFQPPDPAAVSRHGVPAWAGTGNVLIASDVFRLASPDGAPFGTAFALGGGGDVDFFIRAVRAGVHFAVCPESIVEQQWDRIRISLRGVLRRAHRSGFAKVTLDRRYLASADFCRVRRRRWRAAVGALGGLALAPFQPGGPRVSMAAALYRLARSLGELRAYCRIPYQYYKD